MANLILDRRRMCARLNDHSVELTDLEFEILWVLSAFTGMPVSFKRLIDRLHDNDVETDIPQIRPSLLSLQHKIPRPRRLGMEEEFVTLY